MMEQTIRVLNDQAIQHVAQEDYNEAVTLLRSCLEQVIPQRIATTDKGVFVPSKQEVSAPPFHPLPTAIMSPSNDITCILFRECFMLWMEDKGTPEGSIQELAANPSVVSDDNTLLCGTVLLFNLALVHHLRALAATNHGQQHQQPSIDNDVQQADKLYRLAMASSLKLVEQKQQQQSSCSNHHVTNKASFPSSSIDSSSACWLLVLAICNNLGCIAREAANHKQEQDCLALGLQAMQHIDLPLFWTNQLTWCGPSPAA